VAQSMPYMCKLYAWIDTVLYISNYISSYPQLMCDVSSTLWELEYV